MKEKLYDFLEILVRVVIIMTLIIVIVSYGLAMILLAEMDLTKTVNFLLFVSFGTMYYYLVKFMIITIVKELF
jgi:hypothetical protein